MEDWVQVSHQHEWYLHLVFDGFQLGEEGTEVHAVLQCLGSSTLNDGTICQRVAERDAHFNHGNTTTLHRLDDLARGFECRASGTEIERQQFLIFSLLEKLIDLIIHNVLSCSRNSLTLVISFNPGSISKRELRSIPMHFGW